MRSWKGGEAVFLSSFLSFEVSLKLQKRGENSPRTPEVLPGVFASFPCVQTADCFSCSGDVGANTSCQSIEGSTVSFLGTRTVA